MQQEDVSKPNRRRGQDEKGRKKKSMNVHSKELKHTLPRHIKPKSKKRPKK